MRAGGVRGVASAAVAAIVGEARPAPIRRVTNRVSISSPGNHGTPAPVARKMIRSARPWMRRSSAVAAEPEMNSAPLVNAFYQPEPFDAPHLAAKNNRVDLSLSLIHI